MVGAVDGDLDIGGINKAGKLDLEIEGGAGEDVGAVDRINGLRKCRRAGKGQRECDGDRIFHDECPGARHGQVASNTTTG